MNPFASLKSRIIDATKQDTIRHLGFTYSSRLISAFLRLVASVVIARTLGAERLGTLTIAAVIMGLTMRVLDMGLTTTLIRKLSLHISQDDDDEGNAVFRRIFLFQVQVSAAAVIAGYFVAPLLAVRLYGSPDLVAPLRLAFFGAFIFNLEHLVDAVLRAHEKFKQIAIINVVSHIARTAVITLLAYVIFYLDVERTLIINIAQIFMAFMIASLLIPKRYFIASIRKPYPFREVFAYSGWIYVYNLLFMLFDRLDVLMLGYFRAGTEVGLYAVAFQLIKPFEMIPETLNIVFLPKVSKYTKKLQIFRYFKNTLKITCFVGFFGLIMLIAAKPLILTIYGAEYAPSVKLFQILIGAFILLTILNPFTLAGHTINKPQLFVMMAGVNLVLNFVGNLIFIPMYGAVGAAIVTLLSRVIGGIIGLFILKWFLSRWVDRDDVESSQNG
ncbi:MAG: oligosaccharide flippase family protein [Candidatus Latescibacteria bacterium]|nr:oligosaccharide flippase family protein [Candidatus Latescibacterota bacterium]NIM21490.1 oligosaccharide flippase family protein [Candidatus Latescibacterota bacterium]NIM65661.1 oligosaccharide flippase family protein [Candidatus Latescibacterota bacterium]NIO02043.1 oligosaccharide flippase family protein [Candidatus Latescibacterota bacterium]NIO28855.1 oligosaccharide flippase family protein [Candidatus Latescibacterota bacterium]